MSDTNIVEFGVREVHMGIYTVGETGEVTLGKPVALPGAVSISLESNSDSNDFYADDTIYWSGYTDAGMSITLEVARFPDAIKTQFLAYKGTKDGGIAKIKGAKKPSVYIAFESEGDKQSRRGLLLNCSLGDIKREYKTTEDKTDPDTESIEGKVVGDNKTGITMITYNPGDAGYSTLFTAPTVPEVGEASV